MSQNPPEVDESNYYSPQALASRMFALDLQVENLKAIVRLNIQHMNEVDVAVLDLQHQIRMCMARHDEGEKK